MRRRPLSVPLCVIALLLLPPVMASAAIRLVDVSAAAGVGAAGEGNGAAFGDADGDGWPDLLVTRNLNSDASLLYRNRGDGTFDPNGFSWTPSLGTVGGLFVDIDGDADQDLYVIVHEGPNQLQRNEGGVFVPVENPADFHENGNAMGAFFADLDGDGAVDVLTTHRYWFASQWLHDLGTPQMADMAPLASPLRSGNDVFGATPFDYDEDGDLDVYIAALLHPNLLHRNDGAGVFRTLPDAAGMASLAASLAALPGDADGDGHLDLYVLNGARQANHLYTRSNTASGVHYDDIAASAGVSGTESSSGGAWVDLDNDGDEDLLVSSVRGALRVYRNDDARFVDVAAAAIGTALPGGGSSGVAVADVDRDGDVDVFLTTPNDGDVLLRNDSDGGDWLELDLGGAASLSGTRVEVRSGGTTQVRQFVMASSIGTQHGELLHFGLGSAAPDSVDVVLDWPSGQRQLLRAARNGSLRPHELRTGRDLALARVLAPGLAPGWSGFAPRVAVVNHGAESSGGTVAVRIAGPGPTWARRQVVPVLAPGDTAIVELDGWRPERPGTWEVSIRLEGVDDVPGNDSWQRAYAFHQFREVGGDLGVDDAGPGWAGAFADYDNDGDLDLYVSNGGSTGRGDNVLYRNDGAAGFADVTEAAGVADDGNGTGVTFADFDRDGDQDLFLARGGFYEDGQTDRLLRNDGDGTFADVSSAAGFDDVGSSYAAIVGDHDRDGYLDLVVSRLRGQEAAFYRNVGGRFEDITHSKQILSSFSYSTSAGSFSDYDNDGDVDLYLGTFGHYDHFYADVGDSIYAVSAVGDQGQMVAVTLGDYDGDADLDIYTVNFNGRSVLYQNDVAATTLNDVGSETGTENKAFGQGCTFVDYDSDGDLDLYVINSRLPDRLYENLGDGAFVDRAAAFGLDDATRGRAVLVGDIDNDGDPDAYVIHQNQPNRLYVNGGGATGWLDVGLRGTTSNTDAIGARVTAYVGGRALLREVNGTAGMSYNSRVVHFGLGTATRVDSLSVRWPNGQVEVYGPQAAGTRVRLVEGGALTAVGEALATTPAAVRLDGVYPNPFNSTAVIGFELPHDGAVDVGVYNALGQRLRTLLREERPAGTHRLTWDGRDDTDREVASGAYYVRLEAFGQRQVRPMVLLR